GVFTDRLFGSDDTRLKVRDILRCGGPLGSFFLREDTDKPIILLGSGTGFAPLKAMVEHMVHQGVQREVTLYWGGRRPRDLYMSELVESWVRTIPGFRYVPVVSEAAPEDAWHGRTG